MVVNLSDTPQILHFSDNVAFCNNGTVIYGFLIELPEIYTLSEGDFDNIHNLWFNSLKDFSKGTIIHKMDIYQKKPYNSDITGNSFLQNATRKHFNGRDFLEHYSFLFFTYRDAYWESANIKNPFKKPSSSKLLLESFHKDAEFSISVQRAADYLNNSKYFSVQKIDQSVFQYLEHSYFNGFYEDRFTDIDTKKHKIGSKKFSVVAIREAKQFGESISNCSLNSKMCVGDYIFHKGYADGLGFNIDCTHIFNQVIFFKDHKEEKSKIEKQRQTLFSVRKFSSDFEVGSKQLGEYLDEINQDEKILLGNAHFNVIIYGNNEEECDYYEKICCNEFKNMDIKPYIPTGSNKTNLFANSFFANVANIDKNNIITNFDFQQSLCMLVNSTNYKNDTNGIYFNDRVFNVPIKKDVWDDDKKRIKARNFFIVAPTGEGKSVLALNVLRQFYESGVNIVIIDLGDSYRKFSLLYPNDTAYIKYKEGLSLGINPFELRSELNSEIITELASFVFKLWKRDRLPEEAEAVSMRKILSLYFDAVKTNHSFPDFYLFVQSNKTDLMKALELTEEFFDISDFLHITSEFVGNGTYAYLFSQNSDVIERITDKKVIIFELDEAKDNHVLLGILIQMINVIIQNTVWRDRSQKGIVFFDEFAKMLKFPTILSTAEYFFQAARKQLAAIGIVLQSPAQLPNNESARSIIDNTQVMYILQNEKGYDEIIDRLGLKEHDRNQLGSIKSVFKGAGYKYAEFLLKIGSESNIVRLELPREVLVAYATEGKEYTEVLKYYEDNKNMELAISKYIENYG